MADVTRTNYAANSVLTSTALNADFNQIVTRINTFPGEQITDGTVTKDKLVTGATADLTLTSKTTTYTVTTSDQVNLADATGGAFTYTLPTAAGNDGLQLFFKKTDTSTNVVTIDGNGSETIDGETTFLVPRQYNWVKILSDGTNWQVVDHNCKVIVTGSSNNGGAITAAVTNINWTEVIDSHGAWSGSLFTAPRNGVYIFNGQYTCTAVSSRHAQMYKNSTYIYSYSVAGGASIASGIFTFTVYLDEGDTASIRDQDGGTLRNDTTQINWLAIREL